jgi:hypothetical protein
MSDALKEKFIDVHASADFLAPIPLSKSIEKYYKDSIIEMLMRPLPSWIYLTKEAKPPAGFRTEFVQRIDRMKYLMAVGYPEDAGAIAKELATKVYDERLDRYTCEITGNKYFHECHCEDW